MRWRTSKERGLGGLDEVEDSSLVADSGRKVRCCEADHRMALSLMVKDHVVGCGGCIIDATFLMDEERRIQVEAVE